MVVGLSERETADRTCAIVQFEGVHEEVVPSLVHALNRCKVRPTAYINARCLETRGDVFAGMTALDCDVNYLPIATRQDWLQLASTVQTGGYDFLVLSTYQLDGAADWARARKESGLREAFRDSTGTVRRGAPPGQTVSAFPGFRLRSNRPWHPRR